MKIAPGDIAGHLEGCRRFSFSTPHGCSKNLATIFVCPINSGNARRKPALRSRETFVPYKQWLADGWPVIGGLRRAASAKPAEIALPGGLPLKPYLVEIRQDEAAIL